MCRASKQITKRDLAKHFLGGKELGGTIPGSCQGFNTFLKHEVKRNKRAQYYTMDATRANSCDIAAYEPRNLKTHKLWQVLDGSPIASFLDAPHAR